MYLTFWPIDRAEIERLEATKIDLHNRIAEEVVASIFFWLYLLFICMHIFNHHWFLVNSGSRECSFTSKSPETKECFAWATPSPWARCISFLSSLRIRLNLFLFYFTYATLSMWFGWLEIHILIFQTFKYNWLWDVLWLHSWKLGEDLLMQSSFSVLWLLVLHLKGLWGDSNLPLPYCINLFHITW